MMKNLGLIFFVLTLIAVGLYLLSRGYWVPMTQSVKGKRTVADVVEQTGDAAKSRLLPHFEKAGVSYPPEQVTLLAMKEEHKLELWATSDDEYRRVHIYDIKKLSGVAGPKLREGDKQVPEGIYKIIGLNPNSAYHLSMKLNYPNEFDLQYAKAEHRTEPGTNIFIHGKAQSIGCLAMGDNNIEELFLLANDVGHTNFTVVIAPQDPRVNTLKALATNPTWTVDLYQDITHAFTAFPKG